MELRFSDLRKANLKRLPLFKNAHGKIAHSSPDGSDWTPSDWIMAVMGELGELANILKKLRRGDYEQYQVQQAIEDELADVQTYLDILAFNLKVDLGQATINKFNQVSRRVDCDVKLEGERKRKCPYAGCENPYTATPPCALCYE